jgi:hypothetical protein
MRLPDSNGLPNNQLNESDSIKIIAEPSPDGLKTFIKDIRRIS